ncbi:MAG: pilus assembly FimT family protein [bacterium JZ-2024 1]
MNLQRRKRATGFTLIEVLVVITVILIVLTLGFGALKKAVPAQRLNTGSHIILSDFRVAQFKAAQEGVAYVLEIISDYSLPQGGSPRHLGNVYRLWREPDFTKYIGNNPRCPHGQTSNTHLTGFPAPFLVYDLLDTTANPPTMNLFNTLNTFPNGCGDSDTPRFSDEELPLPVFESVPMNFVDDPSVSANPNFRFIRKLQKFHRRYVIPEGVKLVVPYRVPTSAECTVNEPSWWAIYFLPAGGTQAVQFTAQPSGDMDSPCEEPPLGTGVFHMGLVLEKRVALGDNFTQSSGLITRYCYAESNARGIEIVLASATIRLVGSRPARYAANPPDPDCNPDPNVWR